MPLNKSGVAKPNLYEQDLGVEIQMSNKECLSIIIGLPILLSLGTGLIFALVVGYALFQRVVHQIANSYDIPLLLVYLLVILGLLFYIFIIWYISKRQKQVFEAYGLEHNIQYDTTQYIKMVVGITLVVTIISAVIILMGIGLFTLQVGRAK
jgi:hypothetical protein